MSPADRRLAALAAALAPASAERLMLLVAEVGPSAAALTAALVRGARAERVEAVAAAFAEVDARSRSPLESAAHPLLRRLAREEGAAARTS